MRIIVRSCRSKRDEATVLYLARRSSRLTSLRVLSLLIIAGLFPGCASFTIDVPQPARLSLPATGGIVIAVPDTSYQEVVLGLKLKTKLRKAHYYSLPANKDLADYLVRTGHSIQDLWKDPKLAQGLNMDMVLTPRVIEWKKEKSAPQRRVRPEGPGVVLACTVVTGTLRTGFTLWRTGDGAKLFEEEITSSRHTKECTNDWDKTPDVPTADADARTASKSGPDPFLTGTPDASWKKDPLFESTVEKAVSSFIDHINPKSFREVYIVVNDTAGYESARQLVKARRYLRDGNWAAAITLLEENLGRHPDSYATLYLMGVAEQGQRKFEAAKQRYQQALTLCQSKRDASTSEVVPDCDSIEEAVKRTQTWSTEGASKNGTGTE